MYVDQPESIEGGGSYLDQPGTYHLLVTQVEENPPGNDGEPLEGLRVTASVLAGTDDSQKDKSTSIMFWAPKPDDNSDLRKRRLTRFCLATMLLAEHKPGRAEVDPEQARGRQFVAKFNFRQKKNQQTGKWEDTERVDIAYADIWHVDDPEVQKRQFPLDAESLKMIHASLRKQPASQVAPAGGNANLAAI